MSATLDAQTNDRYYTESVDQQSNLYDPGQVAVYDQPYVDNSGTNTLTDNAPQPDTQAQDTQQGNQVNNPSAYTSGSNELPYAMTAQGMMEAMKQASASGVEPSLVDRISSKVGDLFGGLSAFGKNNKDNPLLQMALAGVAGAQKNSSAKEQLALAQKYKLEQLDHEAKIARDKIAANSASVASIPRTKGIIAHALTRLGGVPVFNANGTMQ